MARVVYLDTHAVVWLYAGELSLFPARVLRLIEEADIKISPIVRLELQYLLEINRIKVKPEKILTELKEAIGLQIDNQNFDNVVLESLKYTWTRDPFDRLIVAQTQMAWAHLITKDERILKHYKKALWAAE